MNEKSGTIEHIEPLFKSQDGYAFWWLLKLKDEPKQFALHQNWFYNELKPKELRSLKIGDKVGYVTSKCKMGLDGRMGINERGYLLFDELRKTEEAKELEAGEPEL